MVDIPSEFRAHLESYRGPLDLLLFLIKRDEIDIFDIPIAKIIAQYQIYMEILREVDPNLCGEFLVVAAHLMEIKSKMLLPREDLAGEDEELDDPRLELVRQLLEYKKYKERALLLERRMADRNRRYERPPVDIDWGDVDDSGPIELGNVSIWDLFTAFHRIQLLIGSREPHRVVSSDRPIEEYVRAITEILSVAPNRTARFEDLFADARNRQEAIGTFLAVLEMAKERLLVIFQEEIFGPIDVRLRDEEEIARSRAEAAAALSVEPAERFLMEGEGAEALREPVDDGASEGSSDSFSDSSSDHLSDSLCEGFSDSVSGGLSGGASEGLSDGSSGGSSGRVSPADGASRLPPETSP